MLGSENQFMKKPGISVVIPGLGRRKIVSLLSNYTGMLSLYGKLSRGAEDSLLELSRKVDIHILTADTFGRAEAQLRHLPLTRHKLKGQGGDHDVQECFFLNGVMLELWWHSEMATTTGCS
jgi:hypothetical protein